jgi:hypothetical protein
VTAAIIGSLPAATAATQGSGDPSKTAAVPIRFWEEMNQLLSGDMPQRGEL